MQEHLTTRCALLILAGGTSSRMGTPKALLTHASTATTSSAAVPLLEHWFLLGETTGLSPIVTVLGTHAQAVCDAMPHRKPQSLINPAPERGQSSSLSIGLLRLQECALPCLVTPVDCPPLPMTTFQTVISRLLTHAAALNGAFTALLPTWNDQPGHPVLLSSACVASLATQNPLPPLDAILAQSHDVYKVPVDAPEILVNLNTQTDLAHWKKSL